MTVSLALLPHAYATVRFLAKEIPLKMSQKLQLVHIQLSDFQQELVALPARQCGGLLTGVVATVIYLRIQFKLIVSTNRDLPVLFLLFSGPDSFK